jgi:transposase
MFHIGLDVGSCKTYFCICRPDGEIAMESSVKTTLLPRFFRELADARGSCRIVLESCAEAFQIGAWGKEKGHDVRIVPASFARSLGIGEHGIKTDKRDARALAQASCRVELRSIHVKALKSREILSATTARRTLVECRTATINSVRGWMRTLVIPIKSGRTTSFGDRVRTALEAAGYETPTHIRCQLEAIEHLNEQIEKLGKELDEIAKQDPVCRLLMTHPGVGALIALEFRATIDDPKRFKHGDKVASYIGLTAGENSSSKRKRRTSITKAGSPELRRLLCQGGWSYWRTQDTSVVHWARKIAERRGKKIALVAIMRKMAVTLWAMWKRNESYKALHVSEHSAAA